MSYAPFQDNPDLAGVGETTQAVLENLAEHIDASAQRALHTEQCACDRGEDCPHYPHGYQAHAEEALGWLAGAGLLAPHAVLQWLKMTTSRSESCPECHGTFEVDAAGNFVAHQIAYGDEPCSTDTISDEAIAVGWHEFRYPRPAVDAPSAAFERGLRAAAPLIVATAMEQLGVELCQLQQEMRDEDDRGIRAAGLGAGIERIRDHVARLRGEQS